MVALSFLVSFYYISYETLFGIHLLPGHAIDDDVGEIFFWSRMPPTRPWQ